MIFFRELKVTTQIHSLAEGCYEDRSVVLLPVQVIHPIDKDSPFYDINPADLCTMDMELLVYMEAVVEPSGNTTIALSSYLMDEIAWGWRFQPCVQFDPEARRFSVDVRRINSLVPDPVTPKMSGEQIQGRDRSEAGQRLGDLPPRSGYGTFPGYPRGGDGRSRAR